MWKNSISLLVSFMLMATIIVAGIKPCFAAYVYFYNGEYLLSTPATSRSPDKALPPAEGEALLKRLLNPAHMVLTGLGDMGNATLRIGDDSKEMLFTSLGVAKRLPDWRKSHFAYGYASNRRGDSTIVVVNMGVPEIEPPDYATRLLVCFSPSALPKEYRPYFKHFVPSAGVHTGLATQSGLRLGLKRAEVEELLGKPLWKEKDAYYYGARDNITLTPEFLISRWQWPKDVKPKLGGDYHSITVWFVGDRVSAFELAKLYDL